MRRLCFAIMLCLPALAQQYRAFWADAFHDGYKTPEQVDRLVADLQTARANAIFVQVRRRADSYFRLSSEPFAQDTAVPAAFDPLDDLIRKAHAKGIEVHAWGVVYPMWNSVTTPPADPLHLYYSHGPGASGRDRWLGVSAAGQETLGLDPGHPDVLPYLVETFLEPARRYDIDGLHLDYVRYPEDADYGYNPWALERFRRQANRAGFPARTDPAWSQWRRDQVTAFVRQLYLRLHQIRPTVKLSAATITWGNGPAGDTAFRSSDAFARVFQDWRGWLEEGVLDLSVPMNYFRESQYASYLDRWSEYEKDRQYGRGYVNGLGVYLNTLPQTLAQLPRVLRPSAAGNTPLGYCLYSYAVPRSEGGSDALRDEFYKAIGAFAGEAAPVPELAWLARPERGHLLGLVELGGGPEWWRDGLDVRVETRSGDLIRSLRTDASGFFGAVDLPPGEYVVRAGRDGRCLAAGGPRAVAAGQLTEFRIPVDTAQMEAALPRLEVPEGFRAAPGDIIRLSGRRLAPASAWAEAVPLPRELAGTMVVVNGLAAPLFGIGENEVELQLPYDSAAGWEVIARRAGGESTPVYFPAVPANPVIRQVRVDGDAVEILATGLGVTDPVALAGYAGGDGEPRLRPVLPVRVLFGDKWFLQEVEASFAALDAWIPGRYVVRASLPAGATAAGIRLKAGDAVSPPFE